MSKPSLRVGIDIGGTFSDVFIFDEATGELRTAKTWSTKEDPSKIIDFFDDIGVHGSDLALFCHAATIGVNAVVTRTGVPTGLLHTKGHRDLLDMGRGLRAVDQIWKFDDLRPHQSRPLIPRAWRRPIPERIIYDGSALVELDEQAVIDEVQWLHDQGVRSVAIAYINSYLNPAHERRTAEIIAQHFPDVTPFTSTEVFPVFRELYRTTSVAINAYISPLVDKYIAVMQDKLQERNFRGLFTMMKVDGGFATAGALHRRGIETIHSGPVAGVSAARFLGESLGLDNLLLIDMGGTTADVSIISNGLPPVTQDYQVEQDLFLGIPVVDVVSIGAGGGSIGWIDTGGALRVGPQSAGSTPGPACYGRGGILPTVTDANLVRGTLSAEHFLGGAAHLDVEAARTAIAPLAEQLGLSIEATAQGIVDIVEVNMVGALRNISIFKGKHPKDYALVAFGAAGPMHGSVLGRELGCSETIIPKWPGEFSAFGLLTSDYRVELGHSLVRSLSEVAADTTNGIFHDLEEQALTYLKNQEVDPSTVTFARWMDGMYHGQSFDTYTPLPRKEYTDDDMDEMYTHFENAYADAWGNKLGMPVRVSTFRIVAIGARERPVLKPIPAGTATPPADARLTDLSATVRRGGDYVSVPMPVFDRAKLLSGNVIAGPAVIIQDTSTTALHSGQTASVDTFGNLRIRTAEATLDRGDAAEIAISTISEA